MPIATPDQLRNRLIYVTVPPPSGVTLPERTEPLQIKCRRPDPLALAAAGMLPLDLFGHVIAVMQDLLEATIDPRLDNRPRTDRLQAPKHVDFARFLDRWVCAAAVAPQFVLEQDQAGDGALWVEELDEEVKLAIFRQTNVRLMTPRVRDAVAEFRRHAPTGLESGPDRAAVRDTPVGVAAGV